MEECLSNVVGSVTFSWVQVPPSMLYLHCILIEGHYEKSFYQYQIWLFDSPQDAVCVSWTCGVITRTSFVACAVFACKASQQKEWALVPQSRLTVEPGWEVISLMGNIKWLHFFDSTVVTVYRLDVCPRGNLPYIRMFLICYPLTDFTNYL